MASDIRRRPARRRPFHSPFAGEASGGIDLDSETGADAEANAGRIARILRENGRLVLKGFAVFATAILLTVTFSQLVGPASAPGDDDDWTFGESTRRLTVAPGASRAPQLAWSSDGTLHVAWTDTRDGGAGVYHKSSANSGWTFSGDRPLADGFLSVDSPSLAVAPRDGLVGLAWEGRANASSPESVYVRASSDDGREWGGPAKVGAGRAPALAATATTLLLAYVHEVPAGDQVRLVALTVQDGAVRGARALLGFNASALSVALVVAGGRAHLAWAQEAQGVTAVAHVSVTLSTGAVSPVHPVAWFDAAFGGLAIVGRGDQLALEWSDNSLGTFDVHAAFSGTAGETWVVGPPIEVGPSQARDPAAAVGTRGLAAVVWRDDRTGTPQVFGRIVTLAGTRVTAATQVSDSPTGAAEPSVAIGSGRDLVVAWTDGRHGDAEVYADLDALLDRPRLLTIRTFVRRLGRNDFVPPARASRAALVSLLQTANEIIEQREESRAIAYVEEQVMTRFDGAVGGDPRDDLVINATAQVELTRLAQGLVDFLRGEAPPGTRVGDDDDDDGEPDPPPPGDPGDPPPEPIPGDGEGAGDSASVSEVTVSDVTAEDATVAWNVSSGYVPVTESWVDWGVLSTGEHRTWDNATPYEVSIAPLQANQTYKVRAGAKRQTTTYWSETFSFYSGVAIRDVTAGNLSYDRATITWTTNLPSTSVVKYGTNESNLVWTATGASGTAHEVNLTSLTATKYYYRVRSVALADVTLVGESGTMSFSAGLRIDALSRTATQVAGYYNVTFTWTTNFNGTSAIRCGTNWLASCGTGASGTAHTVTIANLNSATGYDWQVYSQLVGGEVYACVSSLRNQPDNSCAEGTSPKVDTTPIQTPAIAITNVTFERGQTWIHARWNTTYRGNASLTYRTYGGSGTTIDVSESTTVHGINVTTPPLATGTTYIFVLKSTSSSSPADTVSSPERYVTTRGITLSNVVATPAVTWANLTWMTSSDATSVVWHGLRSASLKATGANGSNHFVQLTGLLPETTYLYKVVSSSLSNLNDTEYRWGSVRTLVGPNDANSSTDAGGLFATALPVEPGRWHGWTNTSSPYGDGTDFYRFQAFAGHTVRATLTPPPTHDFDLYLWRPAGTVAAQSSARGAGIPEFLTYDVGSIPGFWRLEVRCYGTVPCQSRGDYTLAFDILGAGAERFVVDVGASGDTDYTAKTPGISVGNIGWSTPQTSTAPSTAVDAYRTNPLPNYREVSANGTFYLNLYRGTWERYNDYLFTVQFYGTQASNVSVWNGAGWVTIAAVYGLANWRASSFLLEHTLFYDAEPAWAGLNVKLRFEKAVQVDLIAALPAKHTTYVGDGSDDGLDTFHVPGVMTAGGWVNDGFGYKNASSSGGYLFVTPADLGAGYLVRLRFDGNSSGFAVQRYTGTQWVFGASASNFSAGEALFVTDPTWYGYDAAPTMPGTQLWLRLVPKDRLNETTMFTLTPVHWETDVGVTGDNVASSHVPGMSVYPNTDWGAPTVVDGRTVRIANPGTMPDLYLNLPWPYGSMIAYVTYKSSQGGLVQMNDGVQWVTIGAVVGDSTWRTAVLFAQGSNFAGGGGGGDVLRMFHDDYGDAFVNVDLRLTVPVTLDYMWVDVDADGDNLTSFGEPHAYAYLDETVRHLAPGQFLDVDWFAPVEGRWQFDATVRLEGYKEGETTVYAGLRIAVDGAQLWTGRAGYLPPSAPDTRTPSFAAMLCTGDHRLRITGTQSLGGDVLSIAFRKVPTDPDRADTDGDGLRDGQEACAKRTDPTNADTDGDGLTDYEETYRFYYNNATVTPANVTVNVTVDAAGEYQWRIKTSAGGGHPIWGPPVEAVVYLDGQLKWTKRTNSGWGTLEVTFDANLPKGLHSLQVQRSTPSGSVTLSLVNVTKPRFTNALFWDTDRDSLSDGDELLGRTGWMISPTKEDTDGDGMRDGTEVRTLHTDPLLVDTDHDGYSDGSDFDPLYDLVVQIRIATLWVDDVINPPASACDPNRRPCKYWARGHVNGNWTNGPDVEDTDQDGYDLSEPNHLLSVNVPDNVLSTTLKIQVFANDVDGGRELDVAPGSSKTFTTSHRLWDPDRYGEVAAGNEANYAVVYYDIRTFRVGKANTLLVTPNDWSTLSNGTVGGVPTGLHRYVGEQRFVFVLLNVTDGHGDLASFDFESRQWNGAYTDLSGSGLHASKSYGDLAAPGRFGLGARLDGTANTFVYVPDDPKLDDISYDFMVAFWIRPDEDYVGGSGWRWSTGREGLWRVGYHNEGSFHGLRFEVTDTDGVHAALAPYSLYAGRWYHVAAVMRSYDVNQFLKTDLTVYVNGVQVGSDTDPQFAAKAGSTPLRIGHDGASGGRFRGVVDELRLYATAKNETSLRGLLWFLHGSNNVIVPRGVFFDSELFGALNSTYYDPSSPLAGATIHGNDNPGTASLNSRVIQMVIAKNATLWEASRILDLAVTNTTGSASAFPLLVASEFYTLGLADVVDDLAANSVVENSGNFSAPPPSPTFWELFWNAIAGWATAIWDAVVAVAQFFLNVVKFLVNVAVGLVIGLTTGNWTYFQENVIDPLVEALEAFLKFIVDLVLGFVRVIFDPLFQAYESMIQGIKSALSFAQSAALPAAVAALWGAVFLSTFGVLLIAGFVALTIIMKWTEVLGIGKLLGLVVNVIVSIFVVVQLASAIFDTSLAEMIPGDFEASVDWSYTLADFILASALAVAGALRVWKTFDEAVANLFGAALALIFLSVASAATSAGDTPTGLLVAVLADGAALAVVWLGERVGLTYRLTPNVGIFKHHSLLAPLAKALDFYAKATTISSFLADIIDYVRVTES